MIAWCPHIPSNLRPRSRALKVAGHGAGTSIEKRIAQTADTLSFTLFNMGITDLEVQHEE